MKIKKKELIKIIKEEAKRVLGEGRYHFANSFDELDVAEDPRAQAFEQCIKILNELTYDSLEDDVAAMADEAARALWKAAGELDYKRNQVGNLEEQVGDPRMDSMKQCIQSLEGLSFEDAGVNADALDNMKEEVMRKLRIMRFHLGKAADEQGER